MFELHHKNAGIIFSFFHPLEKAKKEFQSRNFRKTHSICDSYYNQFGSVKNLSILFRITDGKAFNDKQLELIHMGISPTNASFLFVTKHHINAVLGILDMVKI